MMMAISMSPTSSNPKCSPRLIDDGQSGQSKVGKGGDYAARREAGLFTRSAARTVRTRAASRAWLCRNCQGENGTAGRR
jgi:hypothetical protein